MINSTILATATQLKKDADAAYIIFKKNPSAYNASAWTAASREFTDYCVKTISDLIDVGSSDKTAEIMANLEAYRTCAHCGAELLYPTSDTSYIASSDFVEDFPGWCYTCLSEHCATADCGSCTATADPENCSFASIKHMLTEDAN